MYYREKEKELAERIAEIEDYLANASQNLLDDMCAHSMLLLKDRLARKYAVNAKRVVFEEEDLWKNPETVRAEYPVILSTTFSSRNSLNTNVVYDYLIMDAAQTLLREHYRCHPKIINFCNQKFYRGELIIMTQDHGEEDVLRAVKTAKGDHARDHYSQRQIDVIRDEIIPQYVSDSKETGIIAPYKNQVAALREEFQNIDAATVHKFQGKEKDTIILSTVDDEITDFADDPYLINVAVSRAKKRLIVVASGNEQPKDSNIADLISYIQYHNFEVTESKIYSVFDYLYKQYTEERKKFLQNRKRISRYDSENLMYALLEDILKADEFESLDILCHFPVNMLIKNPERLDEQECRYAMNPATHLDFLLYNRISKKPILAIEVDGYAYHKAGQKQAVRDEMKNRILDLYEIPWLRLKTNGSREKEIVIGKLTEVVGGRK